MASNAIEVKTCADCGHADHEGYICPVNTKPADPFGGTEKVFCFCGVEKGWPVMDRDKFGTCEGGPFSHDAAKPHIKTSLCKNFRTVRSGPKHYPHAEGSPQWIAEAYRLAQNFCPEIDACPNCQGPKMRGYQCQHCGYMNGKGEDAI